MDLAHLYFSAPLYHFSDALPPQPLHKINEHRPLFDTPGTGFAIGLKVSHGVGQMLFAEVQVRPARPEFLTQTVLCTSFFGLCKRRWN